MQHMNVDSDRQHESMLHKDMSQSDGAAHRLGTHELGPHAYEECMPDRIQQLLKTDLLDNVIPDFVDHLEEVLKTAPNITSASLCTKEAAFIHKLAREGNCFCGYRNIQMMLKAYGDAVYLPRMVHRRSVFDVQDLIESAWNAGFNASGRVQTGGVKNTRKYVGTPEAQAVFESLGAACTGSAFAGRDAAVELLDAMVRYFRPPQTGVVSHAHTMPVFLQRPRHSVVVVGVASMKDDSRALIVLDPAVPPLPGRGAQFKSRVLQKIFGKLELAMHCKTEKTLSKYHAFETLTLDVKPQG